MGGSCFSVRKSYAILLIALMLLSTLAVALVQTGFAAKQRTAYVKVVTSAWKGTPCLPPAPYSPACPAGTGFAERYNVTNVFIELYYIVGGNPLDRAGPFYPNATGVAKITWPKEWTNMTLVVKAKSFYGDDLGAGNLWSGVIVYMLVVNPSSWFAKNITGHPELGAGGAYEGMNATLNDDGLLDVHPGDFDFDLARLRLGSGPLDLLDKPTGYSLEEFEAAYNASNPWLARAAYIFKRFYVYSWYGIYDYLPFAHIHVYDESTGYAVQGAITDKSGVSRYTAEIYPKEALIDRNFYQNELVPIPLQVINLNNKTAFHGGIGAPEGSIGVGAPHLNATVNIWWDTVLVNQTRYYGGEYNGTSRWELITPPGYRKPLFHGPLSIAMNDTVLSDVSGNVYVIGFQIDPAGYSFSGDVDKNGVDDTITADVRLACVINGTLKAPSETGDLICSGEVVMRITYDGGGTNTFYVPLATTSTVAAALDPETLEVSFTGSTTIDAAVTVDADNDGSEDDTVQVSWTLTLATAAAGSYDPATDEVSGLSASASIDAKDLDLTTPGIQNLLIDIDSDSAIDVEGDYAGGLNALPSSFALGDAFHIPAAFNFTGTSSGVDYDGDGNNDDDLKTNGTMICELLGVIDENSPYTQQVGAMFCAGNASVYIDIDSDNVIDYLVPNVPVASAGLARIDSSGAPLTVTINVDDDAALIGQAWQDVDGDGAEELILFSGRIDAAPAITGTYDPSTRSLSISSGAIATVSAETYIYDTSTTAPLAGKTGTPISFTGSDDLSGEVFSTTLPDAPSGVFIGAHLKANYTNIANFLNATVFYTRICVYDSDLLIQHPELGDVMASAEVKAVFLDGEGHAYYSKRQFTTTAGGCGGAPPYSVTDSRWANFYRYPNGTMFGSPILNASKAFKPADSENPYIPEGDYNPVELLNGGIPGLEDLKYNYSALVVRAKYLATLGLDDDPDFKGIEFQVYWRGGPRNLYPGPIRLVASTIVDNPYLLAYRESDAWKTPSGAVFSQPHILLAIKEGESFTIDSDTLTPPVVLNITATSSSDQLQVNFLNFDPVTGKHDVQVLTTGANMKVKVMDTGKEYTVTSLLLTNVKAAALGFGDANPAGYSFYTTFSAQTGVIDVDADRDVDYTTISEVGVTDSYGSLDGVVLAEMWYDMPVGSGQLRAFLSLMLGDLYYGTSHLDDVTRSYLVRGEVGSADSAYLLFGGRSTIHLKGNGTVVYGTGLLVISAKVYDVRFRLMDAMGNPLPASKTEAALLFTNGETYNLTASTDPELASGIMRSYLMHGEGYAVFYQLPGEIGYGLDVWHEQMLAFHDPDIIPKLVRTEFIDVYVKIYTITFQLVDCEEKPLGDTYVWLAANNRDTRYLVNEYGVGSLRLSGSNSFTVIKAFWKGVYVPIAAVIYPNGTAIEPENIGDEIDVPITGDVAGVIKIKALVNDIVFTTTDFDGETVIPRLNITVWWIGINISTGEKVYYLETMDASGDIWDSNGDGYARNDYNTTVYAAQFFHYNITVEPDGTVVFTQMPAGEYNITVTTQPNVLVYGLNPGDPSPLNPSKKAAGASPGSSLWPGRPEPVPYESIITWKPASKIYGSDEEALAATMPHEVHEPGTYVNARVVLRLFNQEITFEECGQVNVELHTWAHDFYKQVVDGEDIPLGDASFMIRNDNGLDMIHKQDTIWLTVITTFWGAPIEDKVNIYEDFESMSEIWWNGSYVAHSMIFYTNETYNPITKKNESFAIDMFYNTSAPNDVWPEFNFTLAGNETLYAQMSNYPELEKRGIPVVFEDDVLSLPIPVATLDLAALAKDGRPLVNATIELWILHLNKTSKLSLKLPDEIKADYVFQSQRYGGLSFVAKRIKGCDLGYVCAGDLIMLREVRLAETEAKPEVFEWIPWDRVIILRALGDAPDIPVNSNGVISGVDASKLGDAVAVEEITGLLSLPPSPAKLYLRDTLLGDLAIGRDGLYILITSGNEVDGMLRYARWIANATDGHVDSFDLDILFGKVILPTSGWLNHTFHDGDPDSEDEFHYLLNIVWKDAVVYSDDYVLDKPGIETGLSEVYDASFYLALGNSTETPVKHLITTIAYMNVSEWNRVGLWASADSWKNPVELIDYWICLANRTEAEEGVLGFELIPGPRFMNTTWKYVWIANHSAITWLDNLVYPYLRNNETWGAGDLRLIRELASPEYHLVDVPIMLNAAPEVRVVAVTTRHEAGIPVSYPIAGYRVYGEIRRLDAGVSLPFDASTGETGEAIVWDSTDYLDDPAKIAWAGMTVRYRVEPPEEVNHPGSDFWANWLKAHDVDYADRSEDYVDQKREQIGAYYPDESPTHFAIVKITTEYVAESPLMQCCGYNIEESEERLCHGLCVHDEYAKPFTVVVEYTAVSVRVTDYNGRPLEGAVVEIVEQSSGKVAAWSYTSNREWNASPIDAIKLIQLHEVEFLHPRVVGAQGSTAVLNVTLGPRIIDFDNDDEIDEDEVIPGFIEYPQTYIIRVYYLSAAEPPETDSPTIMLKPVFPFFNPEQPKKSAPNVYDSMADEVVHKVEEVYHCVGSHRDVPAFVYDLAMSFSYDGKPLERLKKDLTVIFEEAYEPITVTGTDAVSIMRLPRGVYSVDVYWRGVLVGGATIDMSNLNVGTKTAGIDIGLSDVSFSVVDLNGRPLWISPKNVKVEPADLVYGVEVSDNIVTLIGVVDTQVYKITVSYASEKYGTTAVSAPVADTPGGIMSRKTFEVPVGDVVITVVDADGNVVGGADVTLGNVKATTNVEGKAVFQKVPLESMGEAITYTVTISREYVVSYTIDVSRTRTRFTLLLGLGTLNVYVKGSAGQGLAYAKIDIYRQGALIKSLATDKSGFASIKNLPPGTYTVNVEWKGYKGSKIATITPQDIKERKPVTVEIALPPYTELFGVPLEFSTFLALIIGVILLVIVLSVLISEYIRWRGRRVGVYPPPKKPIP